MFPKAPWHLVKKLLAISTPDLLTVTTCTLLLFGARCASFSSSGSASKYVGTKSIRNHREFVRNETLYLHKLRSPDEIKPNLRIQVLRQVAKQRSQERLYVDVSKIPISMRNDFHLRRLFGLPLDVILDSLPEKATEWRYEYVIDPVWEYSIYNMIVSTNDDSWRVTTNADGILDQWFYFNSDAQYRGVDSLKIQIALEDKPYIRCDYLLPPGYTPIKTTVEREEEGALAGNLTKLEQTIEQTPTTVPTEMRAEPPPPIAIATTGKTVESIPSDPAPAAVETKPIPTKAPTVAIVDFDNYGITSSESMVLTNRLGTYLVQFGTHDVIERSQMQRILDEQDFQATGCTSDECVVEIGKLLGCEQMISGTFGKFGTIYTIDMRIVDVETGKILSSTSYDTRGELELLLTEGLEAATRRLVGLE